ncbi:glycosyltransferase family 61 protein [Hymenobacter gummosus]|uniref:Glycosyltransferase family 61 protein n=1 Tax=Hymenobacter gummosus TaxID=1776032 RepID=A0A431U1G6_9BACT|nr:glycosyltransferase family 61 protein [Hymenobacter gummosus]RTQ48960.1 glycosyltransferase family 61 protein [Hymenobacter gummosus]
MHQLLERAQRRAGRLLREWLPHNLHYRPVGIHARSRDLAEVPKAAATYYEVVAAHTSHTDIPAAFFEAASAYGGHLHSKPPRTEQVPAAFVLELQQGRLYADNNDSVAVIAADDRLVGDASFQYTNKTWETIRPEDNNIFRQAYFLEPVPVAGTVCSLLAGGGAAIGNYYHWLIDSVPRLHLLQAAGLLGEVDYFLVYNRNWRFVQQTMAALGIRPEQLIDVTTHRHLRAERLLVTSPVRGTGAHTPAWACDFLRRSFLPPDPALVAAHQYSPYVYISRRDAEARHVVNEAAVEELLRPYGFRTYVLSQLSFAEKVTLFAGARAIIAPVGAGLSNLTFCAPGTCLLELLPQGFVVPDFMELAYRLGLRYDWLVCPHPQAATSLGDARREDLTVDLDALHQHLAQLFGQPAVPA